jgi:3-isopropylmalate/(R)-2-methylmalate dehydratase small subunit
MQPFTQHTGIVALLDRDDVDTDQIIPKQFLRSIERTGFAEGLFYDWRFGPQGRPNPDFELNQPRAQGASILLAGRNFGCGSSREHAAWSLAEYGFRAIIAPSFADIFRSNCFQNGILLVALLEHAWQDLRHRYSQTAPYQLSVDLTKCLLTDKQGLHLPFDYDPLYRERMLRGLDDITLTETRRDAIETYERRRAAAGRP